eukprot:10482406-Alexandrium_andersonii.AAC.1
MSASLVGSEMCIRDRLRARARCRGARAEIMGGPVRPPMQEEKRRGPSVSYTHLTLPTICSV